MGIEIFLQQPLAGWTSQFAYGPLGFGAVRGTLRRFNRRDGRRSPSGRGDAPGDDGGCRERRKADPHRQRYVESHVASILISDGQSFDRRCRVRPGEFAPAGPEQGRFCPSWSGRRLRRSDRRLRSVAPPTWSSARYETDLKIEANCHRCARQGIQGRSRFGGIEEAIDSWTTGFHAACHLGRRDLLGLHCFAECVGDQFLASEGADIFKLTQVLEHRLHFVFRLVFHGPSFIRFRARAMAAGGAALAPPWDMCTKKITHRWRLGHGNRQRTRQSPSLPSSC